MAEEKEIPIWIHLDPRIDSGDHLRQAIHSLQGNLAVAHYTTGHEGLSRLAYAEDSRQAFRVVLITVDLDLDDGAILDFLMSLKELKMRRRPPVVVLGSGLRADHSIDYPLGVAACAERPAREAEWATLADGLLDLFGDERARQESTADALAAIFAA